MIETLQWAIERSSQLFERLRLFRGMGTHDWRAVLYQSEELLADLRGLTAVVTIFRDQAVQNLRKESGLDR